MEVFNITLNQMLMLFAFMLVGYFLNITGRLPKETPKVLSKLETLLILPCLNFKTFYTNCSKENLTEMGTLLIYGTVVTILSFLMALLIAGFFSKDEYIKKVYIYSLTISNLGFMGNALVLGIFGETGLYQYLVFTLPFVIFIYTYGMYALIPREKGGKVSLKWLINPPLVAIVLGVIFGVFEIPLPKFLVDGVSSASNCMAPLAMIIAGFVVANYSFKRITSDYKTYIASFIRLVIIPIIFAIIFKSLGVQNEVLRLIVCATALPFGLNTIVFPEAYGGDTITGASTVLVSHLMSIITMPVVLAILL